MANSNPVKKFKPGQSGNPKGRPKKGETITDILRQLAEGKDVKFGKDLISFKEAIGRKLLELAAKGDMAAIKYTMDRLDGMPKQTTQLQGDAENPLEQIIVRKASDGSDSNDK